MDFESYLTSKRIDSVRFKTAEPALWQSWRTDFEQMHPNSFTVQKLNLINPIRRKYQLTVPEAPRVATTEAPKTPSIPVAKAPSANVAKPAVKIPRPGMPKIAKPENADAITTLASEPTSEGNDLKSTVAITGSPGTVDAPSGSPTPDATSETPVQPDTSNEHSAEAKPAPDNAPPAVKPARPVIPRPVIKPKPKTD